MLYLSHTTLHLLHDLVLKERLHFSLPKFSFLLITPIHVCVQRSFNNDSESKNTAPYPSTLVLTT